MPSLKALCRPSALAGQNGGRGYLVARRLEYCRTRNLLCYRQYLQCWHLEGWRSRFFALAPTCSAPTISRTSLRRLIGKYLLLTMSISEVAIPFRSMFLARAATRRANSSSRNQLAFSFLLSVPTIQLGSPSCANGGPNRGTFLEARHRSLLQRYVGTRRPFAGIHQHGSA
jgi:hypothetical protein